MTRLIRQWLKQLQSLTDAEPALKLSEECAEFMGNPSLEEAADIVIVLLTQLASRGVTGKHLRRAVRDKLKVNLSRNWERRPDGTIHHV
jgi:predicted house-cleaning noncanonical NTP pyrophosphatase (MazG superfamily)